MIESAVNEEPDISTGSDVQQSEAGNPEPATLFVSIDHILQRLNLRHHFALTTEVLLCLLVLYTTDTFSYYGNVLDYHKYRCKANTTGGQCSQANRTHFCDSLQDDPTFAYNWTHGVRASFSSEFGMFCEREEESQAIMDITGIGAGLGAAVGGIIGDVFGRKFSLRISLFIYFISLASLTFSHNIQILTLGLFLLGFSLYMNVTSIIVLVTELLPNQMQYIFIIITASFACAGVYLGCGLRLAMRRSWRALAWCLLAFNTTLIPLVVHLPLSPRYWASKAPDHAQTTLQQLNIALFEDEKLRVADESGAQFKYDYNTNKLFLFKMFVILYLRAVVALTNTPSAGKVWNLIEDRNIQYVAIASLEFVAIPITSYFCFKNISLKSSILILGWTSASLYFIGELPVGKGIYLLNNIVGVVLTPLNRSLHIFVVLITLQLTPTCYRASIFGVSVFVEKCFLKIGSLLTGVDDLPSGGLPESAPAYIYEYSFLVFGVICLSFVYVASFLPSVTYKVLPGTVSDFNEMFRARTTTEQAYLLKNLPRHIEPETDDKAR